MTVDHDTPAVKLAASHPPPADAAINANGASADMTDVVAAVATASASASASTLASIPASTAAVGAGEKSTSPQSASTDPLLPHPSSSSSLENTPVQFLSIDDVALLYKASINSGDPRRSPGLTAAEAAARLATYGRNELPPPKELSPLMKYLLNYVDPFMILLNAAGVLSFIAYGVQSDEPMNLYIAIILYVVIFISCTFSYFQEGSASSVMKSFKKMIPKGCHVVRDGRLMDISATELVPGDVVKVGTGDQCPADLRLIYCNDLKVEVSSLTGESLPISCTTTSSEKRLEEARNVVFSSSQCLEGEAVGVVFATGINTMIGRIAGMAGATSDDQQTPMQREVSLFVRNISAFAIAQGVAFMCIAFGRGQSWTFAVINGLIVVVIANIPQGLPMTVVSGLAITARQLGKINVFVKQLSSVETLGSATVIASDKTGTLTQNKMAVSRVWMDNSLTTADSIIRDMRPGMLAHRHRHHAGGIYSPTLSVLERICATNSRARFEDQRELADEEAATLDQHESFRMLDPTMTLRSMRATFPQLLQHVDPSHTLNTAKSHVLKTLPDDKQRGVVGDASETALFNLIRSRYSVELVRYHYPTVFEVPFNSRNKYALSIVRPHKLPMVEAEHAGAGADASPRHGQLSTVPRRRILTMKGAPEIVFSRCTHWMNHGVVTPIDDEYRESFQAAYETLGGFGERVLGFAQLELDEQEYPPTMDAMYNTQAKNYPTEGLVFVGLVSLIDPPKVTVPNALAMCRTAGVKVVMVTGDHPLTAGAIARQVGIITSPTRAELAAMRQMPESAIPDEEVNAVVVVGTELDAFTQRDWDRVLNTPEVVFARTTPVQKLQIVEHLQRLGHIVAVTGDGVNDSPALKKADIGVAMGISGSDVARDAGDVILMDDDFSSIVSGIREGRTIFDNLSKTIAYTLAHLVPEVMPVLLSIAFGLPAGMSAIGILFIDLGTEMFPALSMAYEKSEGDVMKRPPRNARTEHLVTLKVMFYCWFVSGIVLTGNGFLAFFLVFDYYGIPASRLPFSDDYFKSDAPLLCVDKSDGTMRCFSDSEQKDILAEAQTAYWMTLTMSQVFHIFLCKSRLTSALFTHGIFSNVMTFYGVAIELALIFFYIFTPQVFQNRVFPTRFWPHLLIGWAGLIVCSEVRKAVCTKFPDNWVAKFLLW